MTRAVENVRNTDGGADGSYFDPSKEWAVIYNGIRQKGFIDAAAAKVQRRGIIQSAARTHGGKPQVVSAIPERVYRRSCDRATGRSLLLLLLGGPAGGRNG